MQQLISPLNLERHVPTPPFRVRSATEKWLRSIAGSKDPSGRGEVHAFRDSGIRRLLPPRSPERYFVVIGLIFGILFTFVTPPLRVPDELGHLARAYGVSTGEWLSKVKDGQSGSDIPLSFHLMGLETVKNSFTPADIIRLQSLSLNAKTTRFTEHPNMALYSPLLYAPQATGFVLARTLHLPAIDAFYVARLCNLFVYILLLWAAIRLLPFGKWAMAVFGLLPMHILLAGSMSADPVSIGLLALVVAVALKLRSLTRAITTREYWMLLGLVAACSLTKLPYPLILTLFLFTPIRVFGSTRIQWLLKLAGMAATAIIVGGGWLALAAHTLVVYGPAGVNASAQLHLILTQPLGFIRALFESLLMPPGDGFAAQYVVSIGFVETTIPLWLTFAYSIFAAFAVFPLRTSSIAALGRWQKIAVAALGAASIAIIGTLLYLSWTPVGGKVVDGMQARYLTPFFFLLIPILGMSSRKGKEQDGSLPHAWYCLGAAFFLLASLLMSAYFFYIA